MCTTLATDLLLSLTTTRRLIYNELSLEVPVNDQEAKKAIREMNGATIAGQEFKVSKEDLFFVFWNLFQFSFVAGTRNVSNPITIGQEGRA